MFTVSRFAITLITAALLGVSGFADTITLTTGEKIEGKIVSETATELTVDVKISAGVTDQTTVPKAKIAKIDKEQPDETAWLPLKNLKPGMNSLPAAQYEPIIRPLQSFVNDFPKSPHAAEANQLLAVFSSEQTRVENGEVRLGDKWLDKEEVARERVQIGGLVAYQYLRAQRAAGDLIGALNTFSQIEKNYAGALSYPDAVEAARECLAALKTTIERAQQNFHTQQQEFEKGLAAAATVDRPQLLAARQRELAQGDAALAAAERAKIKWPAIVPRSDKNLGAIAKNIEPEQHRLATLDLTKLRASASLAEEGKKELADKNPAALEKLTKAVSLWPQNELAKRLQPEATALKIAAAATPAPKATPVATPVPATPRPIPHPVATPAPEPEKPFFLTLGGVITVVVLLAVALGGWTVFKRLKGRANDILE